MTKKIGVLSNSSLNTVNIKYHEFIRAFGGQPIHIAYVEYSDDEIKDMVAMLDGLVIPGGIDVSPRTYKGEVTWSLFVNHDYDKWQLKFIAEAHTQGKKIFGICRGHQIINIHFGGTLVQDIDDEFDGDGIPEHDQSVNKIDRNQLVHLIVKNPELNDFDGDFLSLGDTLYVNSLHHQAVTNENIGNGLIPLYYSHDIIEAMVDESGQFFSVQFHPEEFDEKDVASLIKILKKFFNTN